MSKDCLVTIGLPVFNSERYLRQSLDSLLAQTFSNFVLIISDNASTDGTARICQQYAAADSRIQYSRNEINIGLPCNFNRVARLAQSRYLKWSTADDVWERTFLERALNVMEGDPTIALCYPQAVLIDADGRNRKNYDDVLHLMQENPADRFVNVLDNIKLVHQHLGLIRMSHLLQTHLFGAYEASDVNLLAELSLYGKFFELPHRLYFRRFHQDSGSWRRADAAHQARRFHASGARIGLNKWRRYLGLVRGAGRSPLPLHSKTRLYRYIGRSMIWDRQDLTAELAGFARSASGSVSSRQKAS
ncbi:MAG TPA: glycosyltransferase family 2 protein [Burkholderiaceae bacterium]|nr:glycosyltransferase family 2 protein [Burkholderiaceae bacterium]